MNRGKPPARGRSALPRGSRQAQPRRELPPDVRAEAAKALQQVLAQQASLDVALPAADARLPDARDRALLRALLFAALRGISRYEALLGQLLEQPLKPRDRAVHALLLLGLAQLEQELTPGYAAVSATVAAARALERPQFAALVNAVLRRYQRERTALEAGLGDDAALLAGHPAWLVQLLQREWPASWPQILAANNAPAPLWLRVNRRRQERAAYRERLQAAGIASEIDALLPDALRVDEPLDPSLLPGFAEGEVSVQDGAAQLAAELLDLRPGLRVLDACAAPGGKTAHLLEREPGLAQVLALDAVPERLQRVHGNLTRLGLTATVCAGDATEPQAWWDGRPFDRILLDAPCSGTGVIRRHPDIRLLRRAADIAAQQALQMRMLDALWPMLAAGGRLVYATCSVLPDENARQLAAFLARTADARALDRVPHDFGRESGAGRQNLPGERGMDGFFYAVLERRA